MVRIKKRYILAEILLETSSTADEKNVKALGLSIKELADLLKKSVSDSFGDIGLA